MRACKYEIEATHPAPHPRFARPLPASGERWRPTGDLEHLIWASPNQRPRPSSQMAATQVSRLCGFRQDEADHLSFGAKLGELGVQGLA
jgi:hypothetical protein